MQSDQAVAPPLPGHSIKPGSAWYVITILCAIAVMAYIDRYVLSLLAQPVMTDLGISDSQFGLLFGLGFGLLYAVIGVPLAHLIDRGKRVLILAVGVFLWSASTYMSALSSGFVELLVWRSGVAIGEAVLAPSAISLIGDMFPKNKRSLPTAIFASTSAIMLSASYIVSGFVYDWAIQMAPTMGEVPWRLTLKLVAVPGMVLAGILIITVREPARALGNNVAMDANSVRAAVAFLKDNLRLYGLMYLGIALITIVIFGYVSWAPTLLVRGHGVTVAQSGYIFGTFGVMAGTLGSVAWPSIAVIGQGRAHFIFMAVAAAVVGIGVLLMGLPIFQTVFAVMVGVVLAKLAGSAYATLPALVVQSAVPGPFRARITSGYVLASALFGLTLGPPLVAVIADTFFSGPHALGNAMACVSVALTPIAIICFIIASPRYLKAVEQITD